MERMRSGLCIAAALLLLAASHAGEDAPRRIEKAYPGGALRAYSLVPLDHEPAETSATLRTLLAEYEPRVRAFEAPIGRTARAFDYERADGPLGNWIADVMRETASRAVGSPVDFAFTNGGGIRNGLPAGEISEANLLEAVPFDNAIVVLRLHGAQLERIAQRMPASGGGFPISGGEVVATTDRVLERMVVGGRELEPGRVYTVATSDFLVDSGDFFGLKRELGTVTDTGIRIRDAMVGEVRRATAEGRAIDWPREPWRYSYGGVRAGSRR